MYTSLEQLEGEKMSLCGWTMPLRELLIFINGY